ncbi:unnamed protein product, partial [Meganyctiphanes norvegica]
MRLFNFIMAGILVDICQGNAYGLLRLESPYNSEPLQQPGQLPLRNPYMNGPYHPYDQQVPMAGTFLNEALYSMGKLPLKDPNLHELSGTNLEAPLYPFGRLPLKDPSLFESSGTNLEAPLHPFGQLPLKDPSLIESLGPNYPMGQLPLAHLNLHNPSGTHQKGPLYFLGQLPLADLNFHDPSGTHIKQPLYFLGQLPTTDINPHGSSGRNFNEQPFHYLGPLPGDDQSIQDQLHGQGHRMINRPVNTPPVVPDKEYSSLSTLYLQKPFLQPGKTNDGMNIPQTTSPAATMKSHLSSIQDQLDRLEQYHEMINSQVSKEHSSLAGQYMQEPFIHPRKTNERMNNPNPHTTSPATYGRRKPALPASPAVPKKGFNIIHNHNNNNQNVSRQTNVASFEHFGNKTIDGFKIPLRTNITVSDMLLSEISSNYDKSTSPNGKYPLIRKQQFTK